MSAALTLPLYRSTELQHSFEAPRDRKLSVPEATPRLSTEEHTHASHLSHLLTWEMSPLGALHQKPPPTWLGDMICKLGWGGESGNPVRAGSTTRHNSLLQHPPPPPPPPRAVVMALSWNGMDSAAAARACLDPGGTAEAFDTFLGRFQALILGLSACSEQQQVE